MSNFEAEKIRLCAILNRKMTPGACRPGQHGLGTESAIFWELDVSFWCNLTLNFKSWLFNHWRASCCYLLLSSLCDAQHQKYTHEGPTLFPLISYYFLLLPAATVLRCYLLLCATICCCLPKPTKTNQKPATTTPAATSHNQPKPAKTS